MMNANHDPLAHLATKAEVAEVAAVLNATLPHLATKGDINRLLMWMTGIIVACMLGFFGLHASLMDNMHRELSGIRQEQNELRKEVRQELGAFRNELGEFRKEQREFRREIQQELHELRKVTQSIDARLIRVEAEVSRQPKSPRN